MQVNKDENEKILMPRIERKKEDITSLGDMHAQMVKERLEKNEKMGVFDDESTIHK